MTKNKFTRIVVVKPGETLWAIAQRELGAGERWRELGAPLGIFTEEQARRLRPGTVIPLPSPAPPTYPRIPKAPLMPPHLKPLTPEIPYASTPPTPEVPKVPPVPPIPPPTPPPLKPPISPMMAKPLEDIAKLKEDISRVTKQLTEKQREYEKVKVWLEEHPEARPDIEIPSWVLEAATPEEAKELIKPKRIAELERIAFAPPPRSFEEIFEEAYKAAGIETLKKKIEDIDTKILETTRKLHEGEARIQENPWLSEAGRVGRIRRLYEMAKKDIDLLLEERKMEAERYKTGLEQAQKTAEWTLKAWEKQQAVRQKELEYLIKKGEEDKLLKFDELTKINALLPAGRKLKYGATREDAIRAGAVPEKIVEDWMEFEPKEKRRLKAWGIDWRTPEGYEKALEKLYLEEEIEKERFLTKSDYRNLSSPDPWPPIPSEVADAIMAALAAGDDLETIRTDLATFYGRDRGYAMLDKMVEYLKKKKKVAEEGILEILRKK